MARLLITWHWFAAKSYRVNPYWENESVMLFQGDALTTLSALPDECVQMCITSPPYYGLRDYRVDGQIGLEESPQGYVNSMVAVFREVHRVLRSDGTLWLNIGDTYSANRSYQVHATKDSKGHTYSHGAKVPSGLKPKDLIGIPWRTAFALQDDGWYLRSDIVWSKPNAMPESAKDRPGRAHEYIFLFSKENKYFYDHEAVKVAAAWERWGKQTTKKRDPMARGSVMVKDATKEDVQAAGNGKRNLRTVWEIPNRPFKGAHFAVFPEALVEIPIRAGTAVGDIVLDPFMGSGTTAVVASRLEREVIGVELNSDYCQMAVERLNG